MDETTSGSQNVEQLLKELYDRIGKTADCRFIASQRYEQIGGCLAWTGSLSAAGGLALALVAKYEVPLAVSPSTNELLQLLFQLMGLVFFALYASSDFGRRAEKMHQAGLELEELVDGLVPSDPKQLKSKYDRTFKGYHNALRAFQNHSSIDYAQLKVQRWKYYGVDRLSAFWIRLRCWAGVFKFSLPLLLLAGITFFIVGPWRSANNEPIDSLNPVADAPISEVVTEEVRTAQ